MPGNAPAGPRRPCGDAPGSEVSRRTARCASRRNKVFEHGFLQLRFCEKLFEPGVFLLQLGQPPGLLGLHTSVLLSREVVGLLRHFDDPADVGDGLALDDQLLGGFELADDPRDCVPGAFQGRVPGLVWPAEDSYSPWADHRCPRHINSHPGTLKPAR